MNRQEITRYLPHRDSMLLLDEVELQNESAIGKYTVRGDEWFLDGHFPGNPVVPGVVLCEIMAQSCSPLMLNELEGRTPYFTGISGARFKKMVRPGDTVTAVCELRRKKGLFFMVKCEAFVGGETAVMAEMSFMLVSDLRPSEPL